MFYLTFRRTPGEGSPHFDRFDGQNFTFPALSEGIRVFRPLRRSTKDAVFGNCKPLKRLDLNFNMGFAPSSVFFFLSGHHLIAGIIKSLNRQRKSRIVADFFSETACYHFTYTCSTGKCFFVNNLFTFFPKKISAS